MKETKYYMVEIVDFDKKYESLLAHKDICLVDTVKEDGFYPLKTSCFSDFAYLPKISNDGISLRDFPIFACGEVDHFSSCSLKDVITGESIYDLDDFNHEGGLRFGRTVQVTKEQVLFSLSSLSKDDLLRYEQAFMKLKGINVTISTSDSFDTPKKRSIQKEIGILNDYKNKIRQLSIGG